LALVGLNGLSRYGFYIPVIALRLFELHLVIEPNHPIVHEEILLFIPTDCYSINVYLHGKVENFHGSFLHSLVEKIYDQKVENGIINFTKTFLISTHTNNYDAYESEKYRSVELLFPRGGSQSEEDRSIREVLVDGIKATIYTDLEMKVIDYGECIKVEISRKSEKLIKAGTTAIRFSVVMSSPQKKDQYKIHIFAPEALGNEYTLFPDEKKAISNSSILTLINRKKGLKEIEKYLNEGVIETKEKIERFASLESRDIFELIDQVNESFEKVKREIRSYFLNLKKEDPDVLKPHSDVWLQVPEFATQCEPPKHAKIEKYSWDFAFNIKPANILVSKYFLDKTIAYHLYMADERTQILLSPEEGGIVEEFNLRFKVEPNLLIVFTFPIYFFIALVFRTIDKLIRNLLEGWNVYSNMRKSLENFHKLNMVKYNLFLKEIYTNAFSSQNLVTILLVFITLMFTLASIIKGRPEEKISYSDYLLDIFKLIKDPVFIIPLVFSSLSLAFIYLYSSYKKTKGKWA